VFSSSNVPRITYFGICTHHLSIRIVCLSYNQVLSNITSAYFLGFRRCLPSVVSSQSPLLIPPKLLLCNIHLLRVCHIERTSDTQASPTPTNHPVAGILKPTYILLVYIAACAISRVFVPFEVLHSQHRTLMDRSHITISHRTRDLMFLIPTLLFYLLPCFVDTSS